MTQEQVVWGTPQELNSFLELLFKLLGVFQVQRHHNHVGMVIQRLWLAGKYHYSDVLDLLKSL
jgi:hypothetical protein